PRADERRLRQRRVADPGLAKLLEQTFADGIGAAVAADVLAHQEHALVARQRVAQPGPQRLPVGGADRLAPAGDSGAAGARAWTSRASCSTGSQVPASANATAASTSAATSRSIVATSASVSPCCASAACVKRSIGQRFFHSATSALSR